MGRTQYCREHIKKTAEECDLGDEIVSEVEKVSKFCASNGTFVDCKTRPIYILINHKDVEVRNRAISIAENTLNQETPTGGKVKKVLTEPEIRTILKRAHKEVRGELTEKFKKEGKTEKPVKKPFDGSGSYAPAKGSIPVTDKPAMEPLSVTHKEELSVVKDSLTTETPPPRPPIPAPMYAEPPIISQDPDKQKRADMEYYAEKLFDLMPSRIQLIIKDIMREHPSHKIKDVFYQGIDALGEQKTKKNPVRL